MYHTHYCAIDNIFSDFPQRRPYYTIDLGQSQFLGKSYDCKNSQYTFTVEQGCRFYLQLNLTASPFPTRADLFKNGQIVESTRMGTIFVGIDRMGIQSVDRKAYEGTYTIRSSNDAGSGEISFQLKVQRKPIISSYLCHHYLMEVYLYSHLRISPTEGTS